VTVVDERASDERLTPAVSVEIYRTMVRIRAFEDRIHELKGNDELEGFIHLSVGQEAVDAGMCAALQEDDSVFTTFRNHGQCIAKGVDMRAMMAEMFGRATGCCRGKGGSMHLADHSKRLFGGNGIVGSSPPLALGPALTAKTLGTEQVSVAFFGEGAAQQGTPFSTTGRGRENTLTPRCIDRKSSKSLFCRAIRFRSTERCCWIGDGRLGTIYSKFERPRQLRLLTLSSSLGIARGLMWLNARRTLTSNTDRVHGARSDARGVTIWLSQLTRV
jgi:hypothetical protein